MTWNIINGNSAEILKTYADNSFDCVVTDPPYGINFLGKNWDSNTGDSEVYEQCLRVLKPGGHLLAFSAARTYHHLAMTVETVGFEIRDQIMWIYGSGFPKSQDVGRQIHKKANGKPDKQRFDPAIMIKEDGKYRYPETNKVYRMLPDINGDNLKVSHEGEKYSVIFEEIIEVDSEWSGWGTQLKPAHEPIVMARKPVIGSIRENVLEYGTGAINIDATRVGERFPANILGEIDEPYQKYFYCPKVSSKERHIGHDKPPAMFGDVQGCYGPDGKRMAEGLDNRGGGNNHPTVKPIELMKYLIKLVTPINGHILDPFNGSGSTGCAAVELGYDYTGIELDPNYVEIANKRISHWEEQCKPKTTYNNLFEEK